MNEKPEDTMDAFFPMLLKLAGRRCLVVGAGTVAAGKIDRLLRCGAGLTVVSPRAIAAIQELAASGRLAWQCREFAAGDVPGHLLVVAATNSGATNATIFQACREQGVLCNAVDDPQHCDFIYPAVVRRGPLQIAISTGGRSPALASRLRRELEEQFAPEWGAWIDELGRQRDALAGEALSPESRRARIEQITSREAFAEFLRRYHAAHEENEHR